MSSRIAFTALAFLTSSCLTASGQEAVVFKEIDRRTVPAPAGVSKELRELIATRQIPPALPVPETLVPLYLYLLGPDSRGVSGQVFHFQP